MAFTKKQIEILKEIRGSMPDDSPITEKALEREGWYFATVGVSVSIFEEIPSVRVYDIARGNCVELPNVKTVGQLRSLAEMCGAEWRANEE